MHLWYCTGPPNTQTPEPQTSIKPTINPSSNATGDASTCDFAKPPLIVTEGNDWQNVIGELIALTVTEGDDWQNVIGELIALTVTEGDD